jgi:general stress protein CsbA
LNSHTRFNHRHFVVALCGVIIIANSLLLALSELLDFEVTSLGWLGLIVVDAVSLLSGFRLFNRKYTSKRSKELTLCKPEQAILLQQLKAASNSHTRQIIVDRMMSEDLLSGVDLSNTPLYDIHLESANLENADLCRCILPEADLEGANLRYALLNEADLKNADLMNADLCETQLSHIDFNGASLANANLNGANLQYASLLGASLYDADLEGAYLDYADLRGSCLLYANLSKATLSGARFDETTVLPDGENWTPTTDLRRFTDAADPHFAFYEGLDSPTFKEHSTSTAD